MRPIHSHTKGPGFEPSLSAYILEQGPLQTSAPLDPGVPNGFMHGNTGLTITTELSCREVFILMKLCHLIVIKTLLS